MEKVGRSWGWALFFGIVTVAIGILVMVWPEETLKVLAVLFGIQLLVMGVYRLVLSFAVGEQNRLLSVFLGVLSFIVGVLVLRNVTETVGILAVILGIYWIAHGVVEFVMAVSDSQYPQRGFSIFMGVISVVAGIFVVAWPVDSVSVLTWLAGIWLAVLGVLGIILSIVMGVEAKKQAKKLKAA